MDLGAIPQDRQVEAVTVERHELRVQVGDLADEGRYQLLLGPVADVRGSEGVHRPVVAFGVRYERPDAHDGVVDVLRELVADGFADLVVRLADETVGGGEPAQVGHGLQVPDDDVAVHEGEVWHNGWASRRIPLPSYQMPGTSPTGPAVQLIAKASGRARQPRCSSPR
jgi:hypothetical protein